MVGRAAPLPDISLPDDLAEAHALIRSLAATIAEKDSALAHRDVELARLTTILKKWSEPFEVVHPLCWSEDQWSAPRPWTASYENLAGSLALRRGYPEERLRLLHRGFPAEGAMRS